MEKAEVKKFIDGRIKLYSHYANTFKTEGGIALANTILNAYYYKLNQMKLEEEEGRG